MLPPAVAISPRTGPPSCGPALWWSSALVALMKTTSLSCSGSMICSIKAKYPFHSRCLLRVEREEVDAFGENDLRPVMSDRDEAVVREKNWAVVASVGRRCWVLANWAWSPCPRH